MPTPLFSWSKYPGMLEDITIGFRPNELSNKYNISKRRAREIVALAREQSLIQFPDDKNPDKSSAIR